MYDEKTECTTHQSGTVYDDKTEWTTDRKRLNVQVTKSALCTMTRLNGQLTKSGTVYDDKTERTTDQSGTVR